MRRFNTPNTFNISLSRRQAQGVLAGAAALALLSLAACGGGHHHAHDDSSGSGTTVGTGTSTAGVLCNYSSSVFNSSPSVNATATACPVHS